MKNFINWLKQGKSRGILITLVFSLLLSVLSYRSAHSTASAKWQALSSVPEIQTFLQEFPELTIKNEKIQGDVVWSRPIPGLNIPVIVNSSSTEVAADAQPGIYFTDSEIIFQVNGKQVPYNLWHYYTWGQYDEAVLFSLPVFLDYTINDTIPAFSAVSIFVFCWLFFLLTVLLSLAVAYIAKVPYGKWRVWRTSLVSGVIILVSSFLLSSASGVNLGVLSLMTGIALFTPGSHATINILPLGVAVVISVLLLYWINRKKKEI